VVVDYQPMTIARLAAFVAAEPDFDTRWRLVVEFLKEYHQEPPGERRQLLAEAPEPTPDERGDRAFWPQVCAAFASFLASMLNS
jgi:hypothetical protein